MSPLRDPTFRRLFAAQVVALIGTGLLTVALGLLAYDLAAGEAGAVLGTALAIKMAAYVVVAPVITAVAYRLPRRGLLLSANAVRALIAAALPFVDHTWQIYALVFVLQAASATFTPAFQSVIPAVLVDEASYTRGLSLSRLAYDLESLLSPILAAALLTVMTYHHLFFGTVVGFGVSTLLVLTTAIPETRVADPIETFWRRTTSGARAMLDNPVLRGLLTLNMVVATATALVVVNSVVFVHDVLGSAGSALAALLACYGAGSMVVALALPHLLTRVPDRTVMRTGATLIPLTLTAISAVLVADPTPSVGWVAFVVAWAILGAATSLISTPSARLVRYESTPDTRTSVFTAQFSLSHACFLITYALAGWLGALAGQPVTVAVLTVLALGAGVAAFRLWPRDRAAVRQRPHLATVG
ncbi:MFS transporter [Mycolicibacterium arenosum]|uniref:MFS transporter n=1 Tax=Mycolicibacterium arenosum TaxID=2952157 RepID=A0ABT1LY49_9MYCO|nr:MFS transporter [Mycolicibacterium sp. CAU 1645]MCP9271823.1 MFS transporter [Mycolicibacterium sp. CAU 1645]